MLWGGAHGYDKLLDMRTLHDQAQTIASQLVSSWTETLGTASAELAEQHEEEKLFKSILDKIEIIGTDGKGLFFIDQEIGALTSAAPTIENPGAPAEA